jgi:kelch-like protein 17 (actinfilin)/kelch-like protein 20
VEVYDPTADVWEAKASIPLPILEPGIAVIENRIFVIGGQGKVADALAEVFVYDPDQDQWSQALVLPRPTQFAGVAALAGSLYVVGGCNTVFKPLSDCLVGSLGQ